MFCGKCGAKNPDDAVVCGQCGERIGSAKTPAVPAPPAPARVPAGRGSKNHSFIGIAAVAVIAVVLVIVLLSGGSKGYKTPVKQFIDGAMKGDVEAMINVIPEDALSSSFKNDLNIMAGYVERIKRYSYGDVKIKHSISFTDAKDIKGDDLSDLKEDYLDYYDIKIKAAKDVYVNLSITVNGETSSQPMVIPVVKIGGKWYIDVENLGSIF